MKSIKISWRVPCPVLCTTVWDEGARCEHGICNTEWVTGTTDGLQNWLCPLACSRPAGTVVTALNGRWVRGRLVSGEDRKIFTAEPGRRKGVGLRKERNISRVRDSPLSRNEVGICHSSPRKGAQGLHRLQMSSKLRKRPFSPSLIWPPPTPPSLIPTKCCNAPKLNTFETVPWTRHALFFFHAFAPALPSPYRDLIYSEAVRGTVRKAGFGARLGE